jgi:hypothetical protein
VRSHRARTRTADLAVFMRKVALHGVRAGPRKSSNATRGVLCVRLIDDDLTRRAFAAGITVVVF